MRGVLREHTKSLVHGVRQLWGNVVLPWLITAYNFTEMSVLGLIFKNIAFETAHSLRINYYYDNDWHQLNIPKRVVAPITMMAYDAGGRDITHKLVMKGLAQKFHGIPTTPRMLGYEYIKLIELNGEVFEYDKDQQIIV